MIPEEQKLIFHNWLNHALWDAWHSEYFAPLDPSFGLYHMNVTCMILGFYFSWSGLSLSLRENSLLVCFIIGHQLDDLEWFLYEITLFLDKGIVTLSLWGIVFFFFFINKDVHTSLMTFQGPPRKVDGGWGFPNHIYVIKTKNIGKEENINLTSKKQQCNKWIKKKSMQ